MNAKTYNVHGLILLIIQFLCNPNSLLTDDKDHSINYNNRSLSLSLSPSPLPPSPPPSPPPLSLGVKREMNILCSVSVVRLQQG